MSASSGDSSEAHAKSETITNVGDGGGESGSGTAVAYWDLSELLCCAKALTYLTNFGL